MAETRRRVRYRSLAHPILAFSLLLAGPAAMAVASANETLPLTAEEELDRIVTSTEVFFREQTLALTGQMDRALKSNDHKRVDLLVQSFSELSRRRAEAMQALNTRFGEEEVERSRQRVTETLRAEAHQRARQQAAKETNGEGAVGQRPRSGAHAHGGRAAEMLAEASAMVTGGLRLRQINVGSIGAGRTSSEVRSWPNTGKRSSPGARKSSSSPTKRTNVAKAKDTKRSPVSGAKGSSSNAKGNGRTNAPNSVLERARKAEGPQPTGSERKRTSSSPVKKR